MTGVGCAPKVTVDDVEEMVFAPAQDELTDSLGKGVLPQSMWSSTPWEDVLSAIGSTVCSTSVGAPDTSSMTELDCTDVPYEESGRE